MKPQKYCYPQLIECQDIQLLHDLLRKKDKYELSSQIQHLKSHDIDQSPLRKFNWIYFNSKNKIIPLIKINVGLFAKFYTLKVSKWSVFLLEILESIVLNAATKSVFLWIRQGAPPPTGAFDVDLGGLDWETSGKRWQILVCRNLRDSGSRFKCRFSWKHRPESLPLGSKGEHGEERQLRESGLEAVLLPTTKCWFIVQVSLKLKPPLRRQKWF